MALIKCPECGKEISDIAMACPNCGWAAKQDVERTGGLICPKCHAGQINTEVFQEIKGSKTATRSHTRTKHKFKDKKHGILWWIKGGWLWVILDFISWCAAFFPRLILRLFAAPYKKRKFEGTSTSRSKGGSRTKNKIQYQTICVCQNCGYRGKRRKFIEKPSINEITKDIEKAMKPE